MNKNKKTLWTVDYDFVLNDDPKILKAQEGFYCTKRELENTLDLVERTIIRCGGSVLDVKLKAES